MAAVAPLLATQALSKHFGGLAAVREVSLEIQPGEIRAIIGPNGAGKTTLVGMICGRHVPSSGRILYRGSDITALRPWQRLRLGIAYTFQVTSIYKGLTCYENVALPAQRALMRGFVSRLVPGETAVAQRVRAALDAVGLADLAGQRADELAYGHQRLLELAMALATGPQLLILDEPTQGLAEGEIAALCALVRRVAEQATVLLIEHNMQVVLALARRVTVMDAGEILAEGTPAQIERDPAVQKAYLGR
ncbi:MAG: ABC transporter ATP-binding protein [Betaproteobacteria bacterium]|nr:MAG: ABC transporter ATP-binding protein [Betaproteobacteria bacterium]